MRLAVVQQQPFFYNGQTYTIQHPFPLFVISFAKYVEELLLFVPLNESNKLNDKLNDKLTIPLPANVKIIPYPFCSNTRDLYKHMLKILPGFMKVFSKNIDMWDICWITDSTVISFASYTISRWKSKKTFLYLRANVKKTYINQFNTKFGRLLGYCLGNVEEILINSMVKKILTIVVGDELFSKYRNKSTHVYRFYDNLITEENISDRKRKKSLNRREVKLLSVGRLVPQKGLEYLIEAIDSLVNKKGYYIKCNIAGNGSDEERLKKLITQKGLNEYFVFFGFVSWGQQLFNLYKESDVFVLPSLIEGFPKTIFEAMAFEIPVIATDVGGIKKIIKHGHNGMLIKPKSSIELAESIHLVCSNKDMYCKLIKNGYAIAKEYTLEKQQRNMLRIIMKHFNISKIKDKA